MDCRRPEAYARKENHAIAIMAASVAGCLKAPEPEPEPDRPPLPVIIGIHGGGWGVYPPDPDRDLGPWRDGDYWRYAAKYTQGSPDHPCEMRAVQDIISTVAWVREQTWCSGRVILYGESAGGHLALLAASYGAPVDAVISVAGPMDLTIQGDGVVGCYPYLTASDDRRPLNPLHQATGSLPPCLIIHGASDDCVSVEHARRMDERLTELGVDHKTYIVDAGHIPPREVIDPIVAQWLESQEGK